MKKNNPIVDSIYENIKFGVEKKVLHLTSEVGKSHVNGRQIQIEHKLLYNFSSYSYLGLEIDPRLKEEGKQTIEKYGSQFGCSRAYVSIDLYDELENLLSQIFDTHIIVAPSTTLAHQAALPVIIDNDDVVILDQQVHASVKTASSLLKVRGIPVEVLRHNRMDILEDRIKDLKRKYKRIWYLLDGVYSMYGDYAPLKQLEELMDVHEQFHIYVDDAHGMSWCGEKGRGYALDQINLHDQMVLVSSLNKAFAGAGGVIACPNLNMYNKIRICGGPLIFSTPIQPPMLGINIASAQIHLSKELTSMQRYLKDKISYCHNRLKELGLPDVSHQTSPIFYVGTMTTQISFKVIERMMTEGFYLSSAIFPAVSMKRAGIRFCININHSLNDIDSMLKILAFHFYEVVQEENVSLELIAKCFKLPVDEKKSVKQKTAKKQQATTKIDEYFSIREIDQDEWDKMFKYEGSFDWGGLLFLETAFRGNEEKENNWQFRYLIIRDDESNPVAATFCTISVHKDDIFAHPDISRKMEEKRKSEPYFFCSKSVMMGAALTEGNHLFLQKQNKNWKLALSQLVRRLIEIQDEEKANQLILRDFRKENNLIRDLFISEGFVRTDLPNANYIEEEQLDWKSVNEYMGLISSNSKKKLKQNVTRYEKYYNVEIVNNATDEEIDHWYQLYLNIQKSSYELCTFAFPKKLFRMALGHPAWEVLKLSLKAEYTEEEKELTVAVGLIYKTDRTFSPMVLGLDYKYLYSYKNYRQAIFQLVKRANKLGMKKIYMGFTADIEKRNFGAKAEKICAYIMVNDDFNLEVLNNMKVG